MSGSDDLHYPPQVIAFLEELWGAGFLSPGGPEEVLRVVDGVDLAGLTVLDIGCGIGGATMTLARNANAANVIGIDVERQLCEIAGERVEANGLADRIEIRHVEPGPLPFDDASFDVVFSKDSIVHIADKETLAADVFRVLRPGGWFLASDWLTSHDGEMSVEMRAYVAAEDLDFGMASPVRYRRALDAAGFDDVDLVDRNPWYRLMARDELERLTGSERARFETAIGAEELDRQIRTWRAMMPVLDSGEHCPHHLRARRPVVER
jgi:phosphoethanolamine N-methyltransferase